MKFFGLIVAVQIIGVHSASKISVQGDNRALEIAEADIVDKCFGSSERWSELLIIAEYASDGIIGEIYRKSKTSNLILSLDSIGEKKFEPPTVKYSNYSNADVEWQKFKTTAVTMNVHSPKQLDSVLSFLKNSINGIWRPESYFFVVVERGCGTAEYNDMFKVVWDYWILNAVILCPTNDTADRDQSGIELYTFNPYSGDHSRQWETIVRETVGVSINTGSFNHSWYIFKRSFNGIMSLEDCGDLFFDKTSNLDGYVIPISVGYPEFLSDTTLTSTAKSFKPDSHTFKSISTKLRFDAAKVVNHGPDVYGRLHKNGSYSGMMNDIHKGRSHLGPTMRGVNLYPDLGMTYPHDESTGCFASRIVGNRPQWTNLAVAKKIWISLGLGVLFFTVVRYLQNRSYGVVSAFLEAVRLVVGSSMIHTTTVSKYRIILGPIFLVVLVIDGAIRGRFISILTVVRPYPNLDTIQQLIEQNVDAYAHDIIIDQIMDFRFKSRFNNAITGTECLESLERSEEHRQFACFGNCQQLKIRMANSPVIHMGRNPFQKKYVTFLTTIHWPMANRYSFEVQKLVEGGIFKKWKSDIDRDVEVDGWKSKRAAEPPYVRSTKLNDLLPAFAVLLAGVSIALIVFAWEIISCEYLRVSNLNHGVSLLSEL